MPTLQDLYFDPSIDDDYSEEGSDADNYSDDSSSTTTSSGCDPDSEEDSASEIDENIALIHQSPSGAVSLPDQEALLGRALRELESPEEVKKSYPPRFSGKFSPTPHFQHLSESTILDEFISLEAQHTDLQDLDGDSEPGSVYFEFELDDFCVYQSPEKHFSPKERCGLEGRYESLHIVSTNLECTDWLVDGALIHKDTSKSFVRGNIVEVCIGALEELDYDSATQWIWIQTIESRKRDYWYRLKKPTMPYKQYWSEFVWLANFAKYFIDFLHINCASSSNVSLAAFESSFWTWLKALHGPTISEWHAQCGKRTDFRQHVLNHSQFLRNQVYSLQKNSSNQRLAHQVWDDVATGQFSHDRQAMSRAEKTVVTHHVASSFLQTFPHWQKKHRLFDTVEKCAEVEAYGEDRRRKWNFPDKLRVAQSDNFRSTDREKISKAAWILEEAATENRPVCVREPKKLLRAAVVVRIPLTEWNQYDFRYAWVRAVSESTISVIWLALPSDTLCGALEEKTFYPIGNELFFTDECNCKSVSIKNVIKIVTVSVFMDHTEEDSELFIHGLYRWTEKVHVNAVESELACCCHKSRGALNKPVSKNLAPSHTFDPPKMKVCALCSGCGLLDHAFCATGLAETVMVVEHSEMAARSHKANNCVSHCEYLIDSVNPLLRGHITGETPLSQEIDCVIAGCPCQGWSVLNPHKGSHNYKSQKNCSILANILSWIEIFMPAYILLENVPNMDRTRPSACAQAICHLVALGYQVRKSVRVDGEVGGLSTRRRLFIIAAAPGAHLPAEIPITHSRHSFDLRKFRTAWSAIRDLEPIENDTTLNHNDPDHIPLQRQKINWEKEVSFRSLVRKIKTSLSKAYYGGKLSLTERKFFRTLNDTQKDRKSKCYKRIETDKAFRTMATLINPMDARLGGEVVHPVQNRLLSLREICRAMGVPDWFLLVGTVTQKHHQLGNGVPWALGEGWGKQFKKAWADTYREKSSPEAKSHIDHVSITSSITISATEENGSISRRRQSTSEAFYTETRTVVRTRRPRRVIDSDDSDTDVPAKVVRRQDPEIWLTEASTLMVRRTATSPTKSLAPAEQNDAVNISDDEDYFSARDVPEALGASFGRDNSAGQSGKRNTHDVTPDLVRPAANRPNPAFSIQHSSAPQSVLTIDLTGGSEDESLSASPKNSRPVLRFKASTSPSRTKTAVSSVVGKARAISKQPPKLTPQKRRAPEGHDDLNVSDHKPQSPKRRPVVEIPKKRTKQ